MSKITKDMTIGDIISKHPEAAFVMMKYGLHCVGCHVAADETLEQGCIAHGLDEKKIKELIKEINQSLEKTSS
ncbi:DUF1858 domain-containing protein [Nanoarchaeota archaeon]